jgi:proline racemase
MRLSRLIPAVDVHADGMPGRVITGGVPNVAGETMLDKGRYLQEHADDLRKLMLREEFRHESVTDTVFIGRLVETVQLGDVTAVVTEITGHGWITGFANYVLDPTDPFPTGFTVGDIWGGIVPS